MGNCVCGERDVVQEEWAHNERQYKALEAKGEALWRLNDRQRRVKELYNALLASRKPMGVTVGTVHGLVPVILRYSPECYALPDQNLRFLHLLGPKEVAPITAVMVRRPMDIEPLLGPWMAPPMTKPITDVQFCLFMELMCWLVDEKEFSAILYAARAVTDESDLAPVTEEGYDLSVSQRENLKSADVVQMENEMEATPVPRSHAPHSHHSTPVHGTPHGPLLAELDAFPSTSSPSPAHLPPSLPGSPAHVDEVHSFQQSPPSVAPTPLHEEDAQMA